MKDIFKQPVSTILSATSISILVTRIVIAVESIAFTRFPAFGERIVTDSLHHYQLGLLLVIVGIVRKKHAYSPLITGIGLGIVIEEWSVVLGDVGLQTTGFYQTNIDMLIPTLLILIWMVWEVRRNVRLVSSVAEGL